MINEFSSRVRSSNINARVAFFALLATAIATFAVYFLIPQGKGIVGVVGIAFITAAVLIYTKYVACEYYYDVTFDSDGTPVFVVRQITGKRQTTLCRISIADIVSATVESATERRAHKTPAGYRKYVYTPTLAPAATCRLAVSSRYEKAEIVIECGEELAGLLLTYALEARERMRLDEESEEY